MHFLKTAAGTAIGKARAAVKVRFDRKKKALVIVAGEIPFVLKADVLIAPIPKDVPILDSDGEVIKASGTFHVTTETIDPYHAVVDLS